MNHCPKLSVIIPTCNSRDSLKRSVLSALNQSVSNLEVIVVDDNPIDSTEQLSSMLVLGPRVRIVRNTGSHGPSQARNFGVESALGELVTFLDDDDCYVEGRLQSLLSLYESSGGLYSFISSGRFAESGDFSEIEPIPGQKFGLITLSDIYCGNSIDIGVLIEKQFFRNLGGFDEDLSSLEDWDLFMRALKVKNGFKIQRFDYVVNRTGGRNRVSEGEMSGYFDIADKYSSDFGERWSYIPRARGLSLSGKLTFLDSVSYSCRALSLTPMRFYLSGKFPRFIRILKLIFSG